MAKSTDAVKEAHPIVDLGMRMEITIIIIIITSRDPTTTMIDDGLIIDPIDVARPRQHRNGVDRQ